jgi:hypothetical protein
MKKIKKKVKGVLNPLKTIKINGQTYYPFWYFNHEKKYRFNSSSKIVYDGVSYYLKYKEKVNEK